MDYSGKGTAVPASTLSELLVAMIVGGILLLAVFDGVDIIRKSIGPAQLPDFGEELSRLQEEELQEDRPDSISFQTMERYDYE